VRFSVWKQLSIAAAIVALAGANIVHAQQQPAPSAVRARLAAQDVSALTDARVAALRAGLKLTAEQERHWPAFEQNYREVAKLRAEQRAARDSERERLRNGTQSRRDPIERLQGVADALSKRGVALKQLADAAGPLFQSLDEHQKRRFLLLSRPIKPYARFADHRGTERD
jgi:zinc resistance-associated protein